MPNEREPTTEEKIADALRAAPAFISDSATVVDRDMSTVLREGTSEWTCVPSASGVPRPNPMCVDPTTMQWFQEIAQGRTPTIDRIGISYMLMGETGADFDHPEIERPRGKGLVPGGPTRDVRLPRRCWGRPTPPGRSDRATQRSGSGRPSNRLGPPGQTAQRSESRAAMWALG
jgi:hypothetical protein